MASESHSPSLAATAGLYETTSIVVAGALPGWTLILGADPQRWYVRLFATGTPPLNISVCPGPLPINQPPGLIGPTEWEAKYRDAPSLVTGEWYAQLAGPGNLLATTCRYLG